MNERTSGAAFAQGSPPPTRAPQPVTRKGVATGQLREGNGRFGGKWTPPTPQPMFIMSRGEGVRARTYEEAVELAAQIDSSEALQQIRERVRRQAKRRETLRKVVTYGSLLLSFASTAYFIWQFTR